jgi:hypothetical protein
MQGTGMVKAIYCWKHISRRPIGRPKTRWLDDVRKDIQKLIIIIIIIIIIINLHVIVT